MDSKSLRAGVGRRWTYEETMHMIKVLPMSNASPQPLHFGRFPASPTPIVKTLGMFTAAPITVAIDPGAISDRGRDANAVTATRAATAQSNSRASSGSSESLCNRVWIAPAIKDCDDVDGRFSNSVVDREWKTLRQFSVQAEDGRVYSRFDLKSIQVFEEAVRKVIAQAFPLLLVKPSAFE
jgi:hypothetical protein